MKLKYKCLFLILFFLPFFSLAEETREDLVEQREALIKKIDSFEKPKNRGDLGRLALARRQLKDLESRLQIAQVRLSINGEIINKFINQFKIVGTKIKSFCVFVFFTLLILNILMVVLRTLLQEDRISARSITGNIIWQVLLATMFYGTFVETQFLINSVYHGLSWLAESSTVDRGPTTTNLSLRFDNIGDMGVWITKLTDVASKFANDAIKDISISNFVGWLLMIPLLLIFLLLLFLALSTLLMIYLEFWVVYSLSFFFLMLFAHEKTKDVAIQFVWYCVAISTQLFTGVLIIVSSLFLVQKVDLIFDWGVMLSLIFLAIVTFYGIRTIPQKVGALFSQATSSSSIGSIAGGAITGIVSSTLSTGVNGIKKAGGLGAVGASMFGKETVGALKSGETLGKALSGAAAHTGKSIAQGLSAKAKEAVMGKSSQKAKK